MHGKAVQWLEAATNVALDHEAQSTADDTVPVAPAQRGLHARHALVWHALPATRSVERERVSVGLKRGRVEGPEAHIRRTSKRISSHSTTCNGQSGPGEALWPRKACTQRAVRTVPWMEKKGRPTLVSAREKERGRESVRRQGRRVWPRASPV